MYHTHVSNRKVVSRNELWFWVPSIALVETPGIPLWTNQSHSPLCIAKACNSWAIGRRIQGSDGTTDRTTNLHVRSTRNTCAPTETVAFNEPLKTGKSNWISINKIYRQRQTSRVSSHSVHRITGAIAQNLFISKFLNTTKKNKCSHNAKTYLAHSPKAFFVAHSANIPQQIREAEKSHLT